ncbi:MAG: hypothetical protein JOZ57_07255 [Abitibacteriaceae bacterium]|nr:hypothetical protein [Abditibacteriaceae bacterium]
MSRSTFRLSLCLLLVAAVVGLYAPGAIRRRMQQPPGPPPLVKFKAHRFSVRDLAFSADGKTLVSMGDAMVQRWNAQTGKALPVAAIPPVTRRLTGVTQVLSPDAKLVACRQRSLVAATTPQASPLVAHSIVVYSIATGRVVTVIPLLIRKANTVWGVYSTAFSQDGKRLAVVYRVPDTTNLRPGVLTVCIRVWDVTSGRLLWQDVGPHQWVPSSRVALHGARDHALQITSTQGGVRNDLWQIGLQDMPGRHPLPLHTAAIKTIAPNWRFLTVSPDEHRAAAALRESGLSFNLNDEDGTVCLFSAKSGQLFWKQQRGLAPVTLKFSPDSRILAVGYEDYNGVDDAFPFYLKGKLLLWDTRSGRLLADLGEQTPGQHWQERQRRLRARLGLAPVPPFAPMTLLPGDSGAVTSLAFSPDSKRVAAGYEDGEIKIWRVP